MHSIGPPDCNPPGPVVIIGNPYSLFPRQLAACWRARGLDVVIVSRWGIEGGQLPDGTPVLASARHESRLLRLALRVFGGLLGILERMLLVFGAKRYQRALGPKAEESYRPRWHGPLADAISISRFTRSLRPRFVFGMEVFGYGLATALSRGTARLLMPWGGDIFYFAETSIPARAMVRFALNHVELVCPSAVSAGRHVHERYGVPVHKIRSVSWGIDLSQCRRATGEERENICIRAGIPPSSCIVMNVRRFNPAWGHMLALNSFIRLARREEALHFVMLGGAGTEIAVSEARRRIAEEGLSSRFTLFDGDIPLSACIEWMSVTDIFLSLMRSRDMRSWSILQAAGCGGAPVLSDQEEYHEMKKLGFMARFVDLNVPESIDEAVLAFARDPTARTRYADANRSYLAKHEDYNHQMDALLELIGEITQDKRLSRE